MEYTTVSLLTGIRGERVYARDGKHVGGLNPLNFGTPWQPYLQRLVTEGWRILQRHGAAVTLVREHVQVDPTK